MNKKFTMMVAALLATGGFSAFAQIKEGVKTLSTVESGKYYYVVGSYQSDDQTIDATESSNTDDYYLGVTSSTDMTAVSTKASHDSDANPVKDDAEYIWKVEISGDSKNRISLTNKSTGKKLAYNVANNGAFVTSVDQDLTAEGIITEFEIDKTNNTINTQKKKFTIEGTSKLSLTNSDNNVNILFLEAEMPTESVTVKTITDKYGKGTSFGWEGLTNVDLFKNISLVTVSKGASEGNLSNFTASDKQFLLQVGSVDKAYDLSTPADLEAFEKAEFIVLTNEKSAVSFDEADYKLGYGFTYKKVKGADLVSENAKVEAGKYPAVNAVFEASTNVYHEGQYVLSHAKEVSVVEGENWVATTTKPYLTVVGQGEGPKSLTSGRNVSWGAFGLGDVVDVKTLVTDKMLVNVYATPDKNTNVMDRLLAVGQDNNSNVVLTKTETETKAALAGAHGQWYISANEDNTITLINREVKAKSVTVQLQKTEKPGIYTAVGTTDQLNESYIKFELVKNATEFDGTLNLNAAELMSTYTLSTDYKSGFDAGVLNVKADNDNLTKGTFGANDAFEFKLVPAKDSEGKLDTLEVNEVIYSFYKAGELVNDTVALKAIKYNIVGVEKVVDQNFALTTTANNAASFILRKEGDKVVIAKAEPTGYKTGNFVKLNTNYEFSGDFADASKFNLTAKDVIASYELPENHFALEINNAYIGAKADNNAILTADTSLLKSTNVDSSFSFWAYSADKEEALIPSYYLSSNGKMMFDATSEIEAIDAEIAKLNPILQADEVKAWEDKKATYYHVVNGDKQLLVKFKNAKYVDAEALVSGTDSIKGDALNAFKFNALDMDGLAVLKNGTAGYVKVLNEVVLFTDKQDEAAKFDVVAAAAPTSNEGVSTSEVKVVANNGSVVVKNAAGKNVVVSTILGQVVVNEVLTSDNATINVPAGIVVVVVEGESFKVNVK